MWIIMITVIIWIIFIIGLIGLMTKPCSGLNERFNHIQMAGLRGCHQWASSLLLNGDHDDGDDDGDGDHDDEHDDDGGDHDDVNNGENDDVGRFPFRSSPPWFLLHIGQRCCQQYSNYQPRLLVMMMVVMMVMMMVMMMVVTI